MQAADTFTSLTATLFGVAFVSLWVRALFRLEFDRWLGTLRVLAPIPVALGLPFLLRAEPTWQTALATGSALPSLVFLVIQTFSAQPQRRVALQVGNPILDFEARDGAGRPFRSTELAGKTYLLKFYRGHWCPYCRLELTAWGQMQSELAQRGIDFVALSPDTPAEVAAFERTHSHYGMRFLSDADLAVTDRFNLRSYKTLAVGLGRSLRRPLAIPTTILVDSGGIVRWIDQSEDHQVRSNPQRVLPAIDAALGRARAPEPCAVASMGVVRGGLGAA